MDGQKKQKVMIAVLAVVVLGAGASFFAFRDSGASGAKAGNTGPATRRVLDSPQSETKSAKRNRVTKRRADKPKATAVRRQRGEAEHKTATRREKKRQGRKRTKKEAPAPAA